VTYNFYDKRYKKDSNELYTYYVRENVEHIRMDGGKIEFPHPFFIDLLEAIKKRDSEGAKRAVKTMLEISPEHRDVAETAGTMELL